MAPANPGYSEKVIEVRLSILGDIAREQTTFLTTSDLSTRLADLWNGVLADDFVFSFRNSLEVEAFNSLQSKYYSLEWELQNDMKSWLNNAEIKLKMSEAISDLENLFQSITVELRKHLTEKAENVKTCLMDYFRYSYLQEIIIQWRPSKLNQLDLAVEQQKIEGKASLFSIKEARRVEILLTETWSERYVHIKNKATTLAYELKGKEVTDAKLEREFNTIWVSVVNSLATKSEGEELRMDLLMEQILFERFHAHGNFLRDELKRHPLHTPLKHESLENSITVDDVRMEHISLKIILKGKVQFLFGISKPGKELHTKQETVVLTGRILQEISTYLKGLPNREMKFQKAHAREVIQKIVEKIDTFNQDDDSIFKILPTYVVKLAVHVSRHCVMVFSRMQSEYNKKHSVMAKVENYKYTAWSSFKNIVIQSTEEVMAGDILCTRLKEIIKETVKKEIPINCVREVLDDFQMSKHTLILKILKDLACKENFIDYLTYIYDAKDFALSWITEYTNEKMFSRTHRSGMSRYAELTTSHIRRIIRCISKSVEHATYEVKGREGRTMALWIDKFCQKVSEEIAVPRSILKQVSGRQVVDFSNLQEIILDQLYQSVEAYLVNDFEKETEYSVDWHGTPPPRQVLDQIWGCPEQCPFCKEPCAIRTTDHYAHYGECHYCVQHRPKGIVGFIWRMNGEFQLHHTCCSYDVQLKTSCFSCRACSFKCRDSGRCSTTGDDKVYHNFIEYKTYLPAWDICPDPTNSVSKYWMWFMVTYQSQLVDRYGVKLPDIPNSWKSITKEEALDDLYKIHN